MECARTISVAGYDFAVRMVEITPGSTEMYREVVNDTLSPAEKRPEKSIVYGFPHLSRKM